MDVQRYISSGIIESYVAGLVSEQEAREVEAAMEQHPEIKAAVEAVRLDMELYVRMQAIPPPPVIKERLMEMLQQEEETEAAAVVAMHVEAMPEPLAALPLKNGSLPSPRLWQYIAAVATLVAVISVILNFIYLGRINDYKDQYQALQASQNSLAADKDVLETRLGAAVKELDLMKDPGFKWIKMLGTGKHNGSVATICWNPQSKETFILAQELPEPPPGKQYQLWAIVNGRPVDAGVFEMDHAKTMQKVKDVTNAQVFAVTLEEKGGSEKPTLDQLFVAGKVAG